jgi:hypothetical protein
LPSFILVFLLTPIPKRRHWLHFSATLRDNPRMVNRTGV